jgi:hypothetical protein
LWHHQHLRGQPFKKTAVRMPGPSCVENRIMLKMVPKIELPLDFEIKASEFKMLSAVCGFIGRELP